MDLDSHTLIAPCSAADWPDVGIGRNLSTNSRLLRTARTLRAYLRSEKVIVHGLFSLEVALLLAIVPGGLRRCYWVIWGGDLYARRAPISSPKLWALDKVRKYVLRRVGHLVTYIDGDVRLARASLRARGVHHYCLAYPGNTFDRPVTSVSSPARTVQVGNSATPSNSHHEIFQRLAELPRQDFTIYVPLAYGQDEYRESVIDSGRNLFGHRFVAMCQILPYDAYIKYLETIDVAIFNHTRQQGMGNAIQLAGMGKKVYLRRGTAQWDLFVSKGIKIYDTQSCLDLSIETSVLKANNAKVREEFCSRELIQQWRAIFHGQTVPQRFECRP